MLTILKTFLVLRTDFLEKRDGKTIVYSSSDLFWEVIPAYFFKKRKKSVKWVQVIHHIYPDWKKRPGSKLTNFFGYYLQRFSFWLIKRRADRIIVIGRSVEKDLIQLGFDDQKIWVSSNGIDFAHLSDLPSSSFSYDGVFLARLSHSKGILDLVEIWKQVCRSIPHAKLAMIGGGGKKTKAMLADKIRSSGLEGNIELLGFLSNSQAHPILKSGKVFVFPSHEEGWGIAIAEAMACGLPVVSWDLPAYEDIFGDRTIQVEENNMDLFSEKVVVLLKDETARKKIGGAGKEFIKSYSWEKVAEKEFEIIAS
jgi:glycosyltransferase involved in cell wall biosynthesis